MAITKITDPASLPVSTDDYQAQNNHINIHTLNITQPYPVQGGAVVEGAIFNIGGDLFYTDGDTAITGTASDYVQLTPSGTTATAAYVIDLATNSVAWNDAYNGYYDASGNLYIFDEIKANLNGVVSVMYTDYGKQWSNNFDQSLKTTDDVEFNDITAGSLDSSGAVSGTTGTFSDNLTVAGDILPTASSYTLPIVITGSSLIDKGLYTGYFTGSGQIDLYINGGWRTLTSTAGAAVTFISNGTNARFSANGGSYLYALRY